MGGLLGHMWVCTVESRCNRVGDEGVALLANALHNQPRLRRLCLASCGIGPEGMLLCFVFIAVQSPVLRGVGDVQSCEGAHWSVIADAPVHTPRLYLRRA